MRFLPLLLCFASSLSAAPPTLTYLFPAGGQQGTTVEITLGGTFDPWPVKVSASDKGIAVTPLKAKGKLSVTIAKEVPEGVYSLKLSNADGSSEQRPFLVGSLPEIMEVEPNDNPKKPQELKTSPVIVNGRLNPVNDVDHYALELKKGQTLVASLQANSVLRSPMDGLLQVLSADGFVLAENHDHHGLDPQIAFVVPKDGRYLVRVFAFPSEPDSDIRFFGSELCIYRLTLTTGGYADYAFPLAVSLKQPVPVELRGWSIPQSAGKIALDAKEVSAHFPVRHPEVANTVFIRVEPHPCIAETEPNSRSQPQAVETPVTISGVIDPPRDVDVFAIVLKKGDKRFFKVEARDLGSPLDPVLAVIDSAGKALDEVDDVKGAADPELIFTAPTDGTYRLEVRDRFQHGGPRYFYRLRATIPEKK